VVSGDPAAAWSRLAVPLMMSVTLGLAPLVPEPHLVGKLRWLAGGAVGMSLVDWGDLLMHGAPVVWLLVTVISVLRARGRSSVSTSVERQ
jgi:hypothetical protein